MNARIFLLITIETALTLSACSPRSGQNIAAEPSVSATDGSEGIKLLNIFYDVARDFYKEYSPLFAKKYQVKHNDETIDIQQLHDGSSKQTLSTANGLVADVAAIDQTPGIKLPKQKGLIKPDWAKYLPDNAMPHTGATVFLVRKGNPKQIKDWPDLTKNGMRIIVISPETTGGGRYALLGTYGYRLEADNGDENEAKKFTAALLKNAPIFENGGRAAITTFSQRNIDGILITSESEASHVNKKLVPDQFEIIHPSYIILSENPATTVDSVVKRKGTRVIAEEHLQYLWGKPAQELTVKLYLRPRDAEVLTAHKANFPEIETFNLNEKFGPQEGIMRKYFPDGGLVGQLLPKKQRPASTKGHLKR